MLKRKTIKTNDKKMIYTFEKENKEEIVYECEEEISCTKNSIRIYNIKFLNTKKRCLITSITTFTTMILSIIFIYIFVNKKLYLRMTIIDVHTKLIIADTLVNEEEFNETTIKDFLESHLKDKKLKSITTDGRNTYNNIRRYAGRRKDGTSGIRGSDRGRRGNRRGRGSNGPFRKRLQHPEAPLILPDHR